MSTQPGMIVVPVTSIARAPAGIVMLPAGPTAVIRLFVTTMSPCSMTSLPFIVTMRAFFRTIEPVGRSFVVVIETSRRVGAYAGFFAAGDVSGFAPTRVRLSARRAESLTARAAVARSYAKYEWPNDQ